MRPLKLFTLILALLYSGNLKAQTMLGADIKWTAHNGKADFSKGTIHLVNTSVKNALLWANNIDFKNGIIELDIKGKDVRGQSFVGVAFHGLDNETYDAIYFRPFNFRNPERKDHAVQYIDQPLNDWQTLREKHPGKYEHALVPDTDPNDWFHVKIVVLYPSIKVYVNGSSEPSLEVEQITDYSKAIDVDPLNKGCGVQKFGLLIFFSRVTSGIRRFSSSPCGLNRQSGVVFLWRFLLFKGLARTKVSNGQKEEATFG